MYWEKCKTQQAKPRRTVSQSDWLDMPVPVRANVCLWWPLPNLVDLFVLIKQVRATCLHKWSHSSWCDKSEDKRPITPRKKGNFCQRGLTFTPTHNKRMYIRLTMHACCLMFQYCHFLCQCWYYAFLQTCVHSINECIFSQQLLWWTAELQQ